MTDNSKFAKEKFWNRYIAVLEANHIKKTVQRWYVIRVEEYIKFYSDKHLQAHDQNDVKAFLEEIGRNNTIEDWQYFQVIDALFLLFVHMLKVLWCQTVDWDYWKGSARDQPEQEHKLSSFIKPKQISSEVFAQIRDEHHEILQSLIAKIRVRGYSIRTEQTYESWLCRFIAYYKGKSPLTMGAYEVTGFLEYLAVKRNVSASAVWKVSECLQ